MICDTLDNAKVYPLGPAFRKAIEFVRSLNLNTTLGRHEIDGDKMYANIMEYETADKVPDKYEAHRIYADLQAVIVGSEGIFVRPAAGLDVQTPYDAEKDYEFLSPDSKDMDVKFKLVPGNFVLLYPQDAHMGGGIAFTGSTKIKKVVVKIALDTLA